VSFPKASCVNRSNSGVTRTKLNRSSPFVMNSRWRSSDVHSSEEDNIASFPFDEPTKYLGISLWHGRHLFPKREIIVCKSAARPIGLKWRTRIPRPWGGRRKKIGAKKNGDNAGQDAICVWHGRTGHFADHRASSSRSMQKSEEHL